MTLPARARTDALRGVAFLAVFVFHAFLELNVSAPGASADPGWVGAVVSHPYAYLVPGHLGVLGVQLFFVLSGFCIHSAVRRWDAANPDATSGQRWRAYAARRFWRIYPLYALVLVALVALGAGPAGPDGPSPLATLGVHAAMLQTLVPDHINLLSPSLWSLGVEVQWYALYPILWLAFRRWGAARVLLVASALALAWQFAIPALTHRPWLTNLPLRWGFEWVLGAFVAETLESARWPSGRVVALVGLGAAIALFPLRVPFLYATLPPLCFALLVASAARPCTVILGPHAGSRDAPLAGALASLGRVSYALYLVHQPALTLAAAYLVARDVRTVDAGPFIATACAILALAVALASALERAGRAVQRAGLRRFARASPMAQSPSGIQ